MLDTQRFVCPRTTGVSVTPQRELRREKEPNPVGRDRHEVQLDMTTRFYGVDYVDGHDGEVLCRQRW